MKRWTISFLVIGIVAYFALVLYANRALLTSRFDAAYWKDRYKHSQWQLPVSSRTIGDDGLFLYEGYRLVKGDNPADYNAEVPPLGKYLIGLSIVIFGNGHWYGFIIATLTIITFFALAKLLFKNTVANLAVTLLFLTDPLLTSQFPLTMLDSLQLFFLLGTFLFLTRITTTKRPSSLLAIALGISFGLFSAAKTPVFSPVIGIILLIILWKSRHSTKTILFFLGGAFAAYLAPYIPYFLQGHSFIEWIGVQKWMMGFFQSSLLSPNTGSAITTLLFNRTQNLFTHVWELGTLWSPSWPLITLIGIGILLHGKLNRRFIPVAVSTLLLLIILSVIPFWIRYLLLVLPFLYLMACQTVIKQKFALIIFVILLGANVMTSLDILFPTPQATVKNFTYAWEHGFFQDMYEQLSTSSKTTDRQAFHRFGLQTYYDGQIEGATIEIAMSRWSRFESPQLVPLRITYFTRELGPFVEERTIPVASENGRWVIAWQWAHLLEGFNETTHLETSVIPAKRGSIIAKDGKLLAYDTSGFMVSITPKDVDQSKEDAMLASLATAFHNHPISASIHHRYVGNTLPDVSIAIGVLAQPITRHPGMSFAPHIVRIASESGKVDNTLYKECCSLLYSTTNYNGVTGLENQYNDQLKGKNGGNLVIKDNEGKVMRIILDIPKQDGNDVSLEL
ncbi:glycosyltransferase family 39 protein [Candidatus Gottesmanbacteria bacterium]|nr:glycosyltransferase family 39 protein [Candidatus Gottesmanbacteria bacterium]